MVSRHKRQCVAKAEEQRVKTFTGAPEDAATEYDRARWAGWSDLESEPAIFNSILAGWGVKGIKTCEVTCMDAEVLRSLPQPIYGIIFLYSYNDTESEPMTPDAETPDQPWFATQNMENMCGSLALLNMVMNIEGLALGDVLERFKKETAARTPTERGDAVADFAAIRRVHNSWTKKVEMLNQDLKLQHEYKKAGRRKAGGKKRKSKAEDIETAYHFVAYMPIGNGTWQLDGMEEAPEQLEQRGRGEGDWLDQVTELLAQRMAEFIGNEISFNVLAMTKDPLLIAREQLCLNIKMLQTIDTRLKDFPHAKMSTAGQADGNATAKGTQKALSVRPHDSPMKYEANGANGHDRFGATAPGSVTPLNHADSFSITDEILASTHLSPSQEASLVANEDLVGRRDALLLEQSNLQEAYREEQRTQQAESLRAEQRKPEYGPLVAKWVKFLAHVDDPETGRSMLETLIDSV